MEGKGSEGNWEGKKRKKGEEGREGKGKGCVMAFLEGGEGWTPLGSKVKVAHNQ